MVLADTNTFIYIAQGVLSEAVFSGHPIGCSVITTIEALGYHALPVDELRILEKLFAKSTVLPLNDAIAGRAIRLRQAKNMQLGDAIIAATALVHDMELWTTNTGDFKHVDGLRLTNPLDLIK